VLVRRLNLLICLTAKHLADFTTNALNTAENDFLQALKRTKERLGIFRSFPFL